MILLIDNYDSFVYNLYHQIGALYPDIKTVRNDGITPDEIEKMNPDAIVLSPGPGYPADAGIMVDVIRRFSGKIPILGVCLGHQAIAEAFGGRIIRAKEPMHGKKSAVTLQNGCQIFAKMKTTIYPARYHSLIVEGESLPDCLSITASDDDGQIMGIKHNEHPTFGVQFHPESVLTEGGDDMIEAFLSETVKIIPPKKRETRIPREQRSALKPFIVKTLDGISLNEKEARDAMEIIMTDGATDAQIGTFLTALRMKGETVDEITGFAKVMRQKASRVTLSKSAVDIVGTGGDLARTFNISTTASFIAAGTGLSVAKHGNRSVSSKSGAADILEALGVRIDLTPGQAEECMSEAGIAFLFAQSFHSAMRFVGPARREMGVRTVFNILGPLANPALSDYILLGVYDETLLDVMANVLKNLGVKGAMIVHGDGLDEVTVTGATKISELRNGAITEYSVVPAQFGIKSAAKSDITGGTPSENAMITLNILNGTEKGAKRDIAVLNAACAVYCTGAAGSIEEAVMKANEAIDSGKALDKLKKLREFSNSF